MNIVCGGAGGRKKGGGIWGGRDQVGRQEQDRREGNKGRRKNR